MNDAGSLWQWQTSKGTVSSSLIWATLARAQVPLNAICVVVDALREWNCKAPCLREVSGALNTVCGWRAKIVYAKMCEERVCLGMLRKIKAKHEQHSIKCPSSNWMFMQILNPKDEIDPSD